MAFNRGNQAGSVQYEQNRTKNWSSRGTADEVDDGRARGPNSCRKKLYSAMTVYHVSVLSSGSVCCWNSSPARPDDWFQTLHL